ncbi:MAG: hypothetical protein ACK5LY_03070 [Lachnospirales bacterium]
MIKNKKFIKVLVIVLLIISIITIINYAFNPRFLRLASEFYSTSSYGEEYSAFLEENEEYFKELNNDDLKYGVYENSETADILFNTITKSTGVKFGRVEYPDKDKLLEAVEKGEIDFFLEKPANAKDEDYHFSRTAYMLPVFAYLSCENIKTNSDTIDFGSFRNIGIVKDSGLDKNYINAFLDESIKDVNFIEYEVAEQAKLDLFNNKIDVFLSDVYWFEDIAYDENIFWYNISDDILPYYYAVASTKGEYESFLNSFAQIFREEDLVSVLNINITEKVNETITATMIKKLVANGVDINKTYKILILEEAPLAFTSSNYPYFDLKNPEGGYLYEGLLAILDNLGISYDIDFYSNEEEQDGIKYTDYDIVLPAHKVEELTNDFDFSLASYNAKYVILVLDMYKNYEIHSIDGTYGYKLGVLNNDISKNIHIESFEENQEFVFYDSLEHLVDALKNREIDGCLVLEDLYLNNAVRSEYYGISQLNHINIHNEFVYFAFKKSESSTVFANSVNSMFLTSNNNLKNKYFSLDSEINTLSTQNYLLKKGMSNLLIICSVFLILIFAAILISNSINNSTDYISNVYNKRLLYKFLNKYKKRSKYKIAYIEINNVDERNFYGFALRDILISNIGEVLNKFKMHSKAIYCDNNDFIMIYKNDKITAEKIYDALANIDIRFNDISFKVDINMCVLSCELISNKDNEYILNLAKYSKIISKNISNVNITYIKEKDIMEYETAQKIRYDFEKAIETGDFDFRVESILYDNAYFGGFEVNIFYMSEGYDDFFQENLFKYLQDKKALRMLNKFAFVKLCEVTKKYSNYGYEISESLNIHKLNKLSLDEYTTEQLMHIVESNGLQTCDITLQVDNEILCDDICFEKVTRLNKIGFYFAVNYIDLNHITLARIESIGLRCLIVNLEDLDDWFKILESKRLSTNDLGRYIMGSVIVNGIQNLRKKMKFDILYVYEDQNSLSDIKSKFLRVMLMNSGDNVYFLDKSKSKSIDEI